MSRPLFEPVRSEVLASKCLIPPCRQLGVQPQVRASGLQVLTNPWLPALPGPEGTRFSSLLTDTNGHKSQERMTDTLEETQLTPQAVPEEGEKTSEEEAWEGLQSFVENVSWAVGVKSADASGVAGKNILGLTCKEHS